MRVSSQTFRITLTLGILIALVGCATAQTLENDVTGTCENGATAKNLTTASGTLIGIDCACGQGAFGSQCNSCLFGEQGTWSLIDDWSGFDVLIFALILVVVAIALGLWTVVTSLAMAWGVQPYAGTSLTANLATRKDTENPSLQEKVLEGTVKDPSTASDVQTVRDFNYNPVRWLDDFSVVKLMFFSGLAVYAFCVAVPKLFNDRKQAWPYRNFVDSTDCYYISSWISTSLILFVGAAWYWLAKLFEITSFLSLYSENRLPEGRNPQIMNDEFWTKLLMMSTTKGTNGYKAMVVFVVPLLIAVRFVVGTTLDNRLCCSRLLTATTPDFAFNILLVVFLGLFFCIFTYWAFRHLLTGRNVTGTKGETRDMFDKAVLDVVNVHLFGTSTPWHQHWGLYLFHFAVWLGTAFGLVMLIMDIVAYKGSVTDTEPVLKGYIFFVVYLAFFVYMALSFYMNQLSNAYAVTPVQRGEWNKAMKKVNVITKDPLLKQKQQALCVRVYEDHHPGDWDRHGIGYSAPTAVATYALHGWADGRAPGIRKFYY